MPIVENTSFIQFMGHYIRDSSDVYWFHLLTNKDIDHDDVASAVLRFFLQTITENAR